MMKRSLIGIIGAAVLGSALLFAGAGCATYPGYYEGYSAAPYGTYYGAPYYGDNFNDFDDFNYGYHRDFDRDYSYHHDFDNDHDHDFDHGGDHDHGH
jgi:hypothetical protein